MTYEEYIQYHIRGDAGVEERMIASLCHHFALSGWDSFRLIYFYTMTYHIPSALKMLKDGERNMACLHFRTDRRYVRCHGAFFRLLKELTYDKYERLQAVRTTQEAYNEVRKWFYFGRYAAYLFLEVYCNAFQPKWSDDITYKWEADENYTKGAISIIKSNDKKALDNFLTQAKIDTKDNAFAIETSLCAVEKFNKGTRWDGYYTERMLNEAKGTKYQSLIFSLVI